MAAFEDFDFFRLGRAPGATLQSVTHSRPARSERDALRTELERIHVEVSRLRSHVRRSSWSRRLKRFVARFVPRDDLEANLRKSA